MSEEIYQIQQTFQKLTQIYEYLNDEFDETKNFDQILIYYARAYQIFQDINNVKALGVIKNNMGYLYI